MTEAKTAGAFALVAAGRAAPLYASETDWPGVLRTLRDVQADLLRVTGREPQLLTDAPAATRQPVVLAGTHERGTIYGLYELAGQAGVSPWHWWADAPVQPRRTLYVAAGVHTLGEPAVPRRGLALDIGSPALLAWAKAHFGGLTAPAYERLAELALRLRGNYLCLSAAPADPSALALLEAYGLEVAPGQLDDTTRFRLAGMPAAGALPPQAQGRHATWLLQVSTIKEQELALSSFLDYAWNPAALATAADAAAYLRRWSAQQFGPAPAAAIASLLAQAGQPVAPSPPREAVAEANALLVRTEALGRQLPAADKAAYFELVLYPIARRAARGELAYLSARRQEALSQGHAVRAAEQAAQAQLLLTQAEALRTRYHALLGGKWSSLLSELVSRE